MLVSTGNGGETHNTECACVEAPLCFFVLPWGSMLVDPTLAFWEHDKHPLRASSSEFSFFDYIPIDVKFSSEPIRHKETIMLVRSKKHDIQKAEGFCLT